MGIFLNLKASLFLDPPASNFIPPFSCANKEPPLPAVHPLGGHATPDILDIAKRKGETKENGQESEKNKFLTFGHISRYRQLSHTHTQLDGSIDPQVGEEMPSVLRGGII